MLKFSLLMRGEELDTGNGNSPDWKYATKTIGWPFLPPIGFIFEYAETLGIDLVVQECRGNPAKPEITILVVDPDGEGTLDEPALEETGWTIIPND